MISYNNICTFSCFFANQLVILNGYHSWSRFLIFFLVLTLLSPNVLMNGYPIEKVNQSVNLKPAQLKISKIPEAQKRLR